MHSTFLMLLFCASGLNAPVPEEIEAPPPNIILILADDLGYRELGCYGQEKIKTPNIDQLAADGMKFTQHYSGAPVCASSRCVLLTGLHCGHSLVRNNWENGGWGEDEPEGQYPLPGGTITMARMLQDTGYATGVFGKWGLGGPGTSGAPEHQGFNTSVTVLCQRKAHNFYPTHLWKNGEKMLLDGNKWFKAHQKIDKPLPEDEDYYDRYLGQTYSPDVFLDEALDFIDENSKKPFFLYYPSPIPHVALQVPVEDLNQYPREWDDKPYLGGSYLPHPRPRAAYAAMITHLDKEVGAILDRLEQHGLSDNTLVMFTSDNGTTYAGGVDHQFFASTEGLSGLKGSVLEGGIRVPLIARWPGKIAKGSSNDFPSSFPDMMPTAAELAGIPFDLPIDGESLIPMMTTGSNPQRTHDLYWEHGDQQALRHGDWKLVRRRLGKKNQETRLFNLATDAGEKKDLSEERPEILQMMMKRAITSRFPSPIFPNKALDSLHDQQ
ncbi:MAG: arylsulfatase [Planctomycetes bacterium]|nr:arylsulfatase [Planctomycetota bacterium]